VRTLALVIFSRHSKNNPKNKVIKTQRQNLIPWTPRGIVTICRTPLGWGKTFPTFIAGVGWMLFKASTTALPLEKGHFPAENKRHIRFVP